MHSPESTDFVSASLTSLASYLDSFPCSLWSGSLSSSLLEMSMSVRWVGFEFVTWGQTQAWMSMLTSKVCITGEGTRRTVPLVGL